MTEELLNYFKGDELATQAWLNKYADKEELVPHHMHIRLAKEYARMELNFLAKDEYLDKKIPMLSAYGEMRFQDLKFYMTNYGVGVNTEYIIATNYILPLLEDFKYIIPGGSIMSSLGTNKISSLSNCFVWGQPKDTIENIFDCARDSAQLFKMRGGVGIDISLLRPKDSNVNNAAKTSSGSVSFMDLYSEVSKLIGQEGRRAALMLSIDVNHPDVLDFITIKQDLSRVTGANISVKTNAEFMQAVENNEDYILRWPCDWDILHHSAYEDKEYNKLYQIINFDTKEITAYYKKVKAKEIWDTLIKCAHTSAEPGILFWDNTIEQDPSAVYDEYRPVSTNPLAN